jgi:hypothetical protein
MSARLLLVPIAIAAVLVTGCTTSAAPGSGSTPSASAQADNGIAGLSAEEILDKAKTALAGAGAVHMTGTTFSDGEKITIDYRLFGENFAGKIEGAELTLEVISIGKDVYFKAPVEFFAVFAPQAPESALALLKDKYVKLDGSSSGFAGLGDLADPDQVLTPEGTFTKGEQKTIAGTPAIGLVDAAGNTIYIATVGEPLPVQVAAKTGETVTFEYGTAVEVTAPDAAQVVDITALLGGG